MVTHGPSTVDIKIRGPEHTNKKTCYGHQHIKQRKKR